jgi:hypothetical protein
MIPAAQARQHLEQLGLTEAAAVLDSRLEVAAQKQVPYADFLADLLGSEMAVRRERYLRAAPAWPISPFSGPSSNSTSASSPPSTSARSVTSPRSPS